jgi:hypothetical protein
MILKIKLTKLGARWLKRCVGVHAVSHGNNNNNKQLALRVSNHRKDETGGPESGLILK